MKHPRLVRVFAQVMMSYEDKMNHGNKIDSETTVLQHLPSLIKIAHLDERLNASTVDRTII